MRKKINNLLNCIMGSLTGVFIGSGVYKYWHFKKYPNWYVVQSAPWYASILMNGLFTIIILAICMIIKVILIERIELIKKAALISGIIFLALTSIGSAYIIFNYGRVNAGYAVVPGIWAMICFGYYRIKHD